MSKIYPCLWFDSKAEEAAKFYVSIFKNSKIDHISYYSDGEGAKLSGLPEGSVMTVKFQLEGQDFMALNGGPIYKFTPAISFVTNCETQDEVDTMWEKLSEGGQEVQCGWVTDKYGMSWQVVPTIISKLMQQGDAKKSASMMGALMQMRKLDINGLKEAYEKG